MKWTVFLPALVMLFANESFAQNQPTADECASLYPCPAPAARRDRRRRTAPAKMAQTDPAVLFRLEALEARAGEAPIIQVVPAEAPAAAPAPPVQPVVNNYVTVQAPSGAGAESRESATKFTLELGGLASVHSSFLETSPGFYGAMRLQMGRVALGVESGYQRTHFGDGSRVEDVYVGPTLGYVSRSRKVHLTLTAGLGFWTTLEDWITPVCGRSVCENENENALTIAAEPGLLVAVAKNLEFSMGVPVRWISRTPDGAEWTLGIRAGLGVSLPYR